jgi:hypothetical protein
MSRWNPFASLFSHPRREQFLARYVVRECARGRPLAEVLEDPYVVNRATAAERARLLEQPEVVAAVGKHVVAELKAALAPQPLAQP